MGGLTSLDAVYVAIAFLVPGFILSAMREQFSGYEHEGSDQNLVRLLAYSAFNYLIFGWIVYLTFAFKAGPIWKVGSWIVVILVGPVILGGLWGIAVQKDWGRGVIRGRLQVNVMHAIPTAWDYKFSTMQEEGVLVTLRDGAQIRGFLTDKSFASTHAQERDLFIERIYTVGDGEKLVSTGTSLLIAAGEIKTIEFWPIRSNLQEA